MMSFIPPRLRKPAGTVLAGALFAAAWLVNGALYGRVAAVLAAIAAVLRAIMLYRLGGEDSDEGALAGSGRTSASNWSACSRAPWPATSP